jgi:hypothetical protein
MKVCTTLVDCGLTSDAKNPDTNESISWSKITLETQEQLKSTLEQSLQESVDQQKSTVPKRNNAFETFDDISLDGHTVTHFYTMNLGKSDPKTLRLFSDARRQDLVKYLCAQPLYVMQMSQGATYRYIFRTPAPERRVIADFTVKLTDCP